MLWQAQSIHTRLRRSASGVLTCALLLTNSSCGSWGGNPPSNKVTQTPVETEGTVEISFQGTGTTLKLLSNTLTVLDRNGQPAGQVILTSARLGLGSIRVRSDFTDANTRPILQGPFVVDLLANIVTPTIDRLKLPQGDYKDITMLFHKMIKGELPDVDPLLNNSFLITGTYIAKDQKISYIKIELEVNDELSLMQESSSKVISVKAGANEQIIVAFRLDQWFNFTGRNTDFADLAGQDINIKGTVLEGPFQKLQQALLSNIKVGAEFGHDEDNDGKLGDREGNGRRR